MPLPLKHQHPWSLTPAQAVALQRELRRYVILQDECSPIRTVAGVDCGFEAQGAITRAAVVVLDFPSLQRVDQGVARLPTCFPYIPGLLSFREVPAVLAALEQLTILPDLLLVDGQGFAHPRRFGIACHLGVLTDLPSIGVGKTRLLGRHDEPAQQRGAWAALMDGDEKIGVVLRTRTKVSPLYISAGHRISLETAADWVLRCAPRFRLPETTRQAHRLASG